MTLKAAPLVRGIAHVRANVVLDGRPIQLRELATQVEMSSNDLLLKLLGRGVRGVHINSALSPDLVEFLAREYGWKTTRA